MRTGIALFLALLLAAPLAAENSPKQLLETAFARIDADEETFIPYSFIYEAHTWVRDGDGTLEEEHLETGRYTEFSPDSTLDELIEEKTIFSKDGDEDDSDELGRPEETKEEEVGGELPELDAEFRRHHEFRFDEWTEMDGATAARYKVRPKKRKKEFWKGDVWFGAEKGELLALDLEPAKRPFGLKAMRVVGLYHNEPEYDLPVSIDMDVEVKIPIIVHKKIRVEMRFRDFEQI